MLDILFVTDFVCPYCLVAKEALDQSLRELGLEAKISLQPLELTEEPNPRVDTCHDEKRKAHYQVLVEPCRQMGLLQGCRWLIIASGIKGKQLYDRMYHSGRRWLFHSLRF